MGDLIVLDATSATITPPPDYVVRVPVADSWINANDRRRTHWTRDRDLTAAWRQAAGWAAKGAKVPALGPSRVVAQLRMIPRRRSRIDPGNFSPTAKPCIDGLVDAGIWPDDSADWVEGPDMRLGPPVDHATAEALWLLIWGQPCCAQAACHHREEGR
jgi:hypothetical protein